jgi:hypothetical protein
VTYEFSVADDYTSKSSFNFVKIPHDKEGVEQPSAVLILV